LHFTFRCSVQKHFIPLRDEWVGSRYEVNTLRAANPPLDAGKSITWAIERGGP
jgi:hypothetical protein